MSNPSRFSVNNTDINRVTLDGQICIEKTIRCNVRLPFSLEKLKGYLEDYRGMLIDAGVRMPDVVDSRVVGDRVKYVCEDGGDNLVERYTSPGELVRDYPQVVLQVIDILRLAIDAGISIDPHIKNFVGDAGGLLYVDFSPPLIDGFVNARYSVARDDRERRILQANFSYFTAPYLPFHFAGDFLNIDDTADELFPDLRELLITAGLIEDVTMSSFAEQAKAIRALEDERLSRDIFMM